MTTPTGLDEIKALYGDPTSLVRQDGTVSAIWEARMVRVPFPSQLPLGWNMAVYAFSARVNSAIMQPVTDIFRALDARGLWHHLVTFDGAYSWRTQRGSNKLSMHAFGGAMDFNAETNALGTKGDMNPELVECFEEAGWEWGGRWKRPDPMHFSLPKATSR